MQMTEGKHVSVVADGAVVAEAIITGPDPAGSAQAQVSVASGHVPVGSRQKMADVVHETLTEDNANHLTAAVPLGDAELVDGISGHLHDAELRAAGATSIIEGDIRQE
jgi:hypothetical protein